MNVQMMRQNGRRAAMWALCTGLLAAIAGCEGGSGETPTPAFVPPWTEARQSLETALSTWRDAASPLPEFFKIPGVQFVDKTRKPNQRLLSFQILGQTDIENARQFTVRLKLEGAAEPELVKYNLIGRDPVWVFRLDDYEMFAHWEHDMTVAPAANSAPAEPSASPK